MVVEDPTRKPRNPSPLTLGELLKSLNPLEQYEVMQRADVLLRDRRGRYFAGQLSEQEVAELTPRKAEKRS